MNIRPFRSKAKGGRDSDHIPVWNRKLASKLSLHHQHGPRTWMCDHFFIKGDGEVIQEGDTADVIILAFLHVNSRLFHAYIVPDKSLNAFFEVLQYFIIPHLPYETVFPDWIRNNNLSLMDTLLCDAAFDRQGIKGWLEQRGVKIISKNIKRTKDHSFLSPIDRMARTLRDMIFNAKRSNPAFKFNDETLKLLCRLYNATAHATLTKIMGFKVCPNDVFMHLDLQDEIMRRIYLQNFKTSTSSKFNNVRAGSIVYLHQPHQFGKKRRLNVEETPYKVIAMNPLRLENLITHEIKSEGIHRKDIVISNN